MKNWKLLAVLCLGVLGGSGGSFLLTQSASNSSFFSSGSVATIEKKAFQGDPVAQFQLGAMYFWGDGVPENYQKTKE